MDPSPFDSWEGATEIFTFGSESFGQWLFLGIAVLLFVAVIARSMMHESRSYKDVREGNIVAPIAMEPDDPRL